MNLSVTKGAPRRLFVDKGRMLLDLATADEDAMKLQEGPMSALARKRSRGEPADAKALKTWFGRQAERDHQSAIVSFQNATATGIIAPLLEESSELEPFIRLGDAWYRFGQPLQAEQAYAGAIRKFVDNDLSLSEIRWLAFAAARWATILAREGACKGTPARNSWDEAWKHLGGSVDDDVCCESTRGGDCASPQGLLRAIQPVVVDSISECHASQGRDTGSATNIAMDNDDVIECLQRAGTRSFQSFVWSLGQNPTKYFDDAIHTIGGGREFGPLPDGGVMATGRDAGNGDAAAASLRVHETRDGSFGNPTDHATNR